MKPNSFLTRFLAGILLFSFSFTNSIAHSDVPSVVSSFKTLSTVTPGLVANKPRALSELREMVGLPNLALSDKRQAVSQKPSAYPLTLNAGINASSDGAFGSGRLNRKPQSLAEFLQLYLSSSPFYSPLSFLAGQISQPEINNIIFTIITTSRDLSGVADINSAVIAATPINLAISMIVLASKSLLVSEKSSLIFLTLSAGGISGGVILISELSQIVNKNIALEQLSPARSELRNQQLTSQDNVQQSLSELLKTHYTFDPAIANDLSIAIRQASIKVEGRNQLIVSETGKTLAEVSDFGTKRFFDGNGRWILTIDPYGSKIDELKWNSDGIFEKAWTLNGNQIPAVLVAAPDGLIKHVSVLDPDGEDFRVLDFIPGINLNQAGKIPYGELSSSLMLFRSGSNVSKSGVANSVFRVISYLARDQKQKIVYVGPQGHSGGVIIPSDRLFSSLLEVARFPNESEWPELNINLLMGNSLLLRGGSGDFRVPFFDLPNNRQYFRLYPSKLFWEPDPPERIFNPNGVFVSVRDGKIERAFLDDESYLTEELLIGSISDINARRQIHQSDSHFKLSNSGEWVATVDLLGNVIEMGKGEASQLPEDDAKSELRHLEPSLNIYQSSRESLTKTSRAAPSAPYWTNDAEGTVGPSGASAEPSARAELRSAWSGGEMLAAYFGALAAIYVIADIRNRLNPVSRFNIQRLSESVEGKVAEQLDLKDALHRLKSTLSFRGIDQKEIFRRIIPKYLKLKGSIREKVEVLGTLKNFIGEIKRFQDSKYHDPIVEGLKAIVNISSTVGQFRKRVMTILSPALLVKAEPQDVAWLEETHIRQAVRIVERDGLENLQIKRRENGEPVSRTYPVAIVADLATHDVSTPFPVFPIMLRPSLEVTSARDTRSELRSSPVALSAIRDASGHRRSELRASQFHEDQSREMLEYADQHNGKLSVPTHEIDHMFRIEDIRLNLMKLSAEERMRYWKRAIDYFKTLKEKGGKITTGVTAAGAAARMSKGKLPQILIDALHEDPERFADPSKFTDAEKQKIHDEFGGQFAAFVKSLDAEKEDDHAVLDRILYAPKALLPAGYPGPDGKWHNLLEYALLNVKRANDELESMGLGRPFVAETMLNDEYYPIIIDELIRNNFYGLRVAVKRDAAGKITDIDHEDLHNELMIYNQRLGFRTVAPVSTVDAQWEKDRLVVEKAEQESDSAKRDQILAPAIFKTEASYKYARQFSEANQGKVLYDKAHTPEGHGERFHARLETTATGRKVPILFDTIRRKIEFDFFHNIDNMAMVNEDWMTIFGYMLESNFSVIFEGSLRPVTERGGGGGFDWVRMEKADGSFGLARRQSEDVITRASVVPEVSPSYNQAREDEKAKEIIDGVTNQVPVNNASMFSRMPTEADIQNFADVISVNLPDALKREFAEEVRKALKNPNYDFLRWNKFSDALRSQFKLVPAIKLIKDPYTENPSSDQQILTIVNETFAWSAQEGYLKDDKVDVVLTPSIVDVAERNVDPSTIRFDPLKDRATYNNKLAQDSRQAVLNRVVSGRLFSDEFRRIVGQNQKRISNQQQPKNILDSNLAIVDFGGVAAEERGDAFAQTVAFTLLRNSGIGSIDASKFAEFKKLIVPDKEKRAELKLYTDPKAFGPWLDSILSFLKANGATRDISEKTFKDVFYGPGSRKPNPDMVAQLKKFKKMKKQGVHFMLVVNFELDGKPYLLDFLKANYPGLFDPELVFVSAELGLQKGKGRQFLDAVLERFEKVTGEEAKNVIFIENELPTIEGALQIDAMKHLVHYSIGKGNILDAQDLNGVPVFKKLLALRSELRSYDANSGRGLKSKLLLVANLIIVAESAVWVLTVGAGSMVGKMYELAKVVLSWEDRLEARRRLLERFENDQAYGHKAETLIEYTKPMWYGGDKIIEEALQLNDAELRVFIDKVSNALRPSPIVVPFQRRSREITGIERVIKAVREKDAGQFEVHVGIVRDAVAFGPSDFTYYEFRVVSRSELRNRVSILEDGRTITIDEKPYSVKDALDAVWRLKQNKIPAYRDPKSDSPGKQGVIYYDANHIDYRFTVSTRSELRQGELFEGRLAGEKVDEMADEILEENKGAKHLTITVHYGGQVIAEASSEDEYPALGSTVEDVLFGEDSAENLKAAQFAITRTHANIFLTREEDDGSSQVVANPRPSPSDLEAEADHSNAVPGGLIWEEPADELDGAKSELRQEVPGETNNKVLFNLAIKFGGKETAFPAKVKGNYKLSQLATAIITNSGLEDDVKKAALAALTDPESKLKILISVQFRAIKGKSYPKQDYAADVRADGDHDIASLLKRIYNGVSKSVDPSLRDLSHLVEDGAVTVSLTDVSTASAVPAALELIKDPNSTTKVRDLDILMNNVTVPLKQAFDKLGTPFQYPAPRENIRRDLSNSIDALDDISAGFSLDYLDAQLWANGLRNWSDKLQEVQRSISKVKSNSDHLKTIAALINQIGKELSAELQAQRSVIDREFSGTKASQAVVKLREILPAFEAQTQELNKQLKAALILFRDEIAPRSELRATTAYQVDEDDLRVDIKIGTSGWRATTAPSGKHKNAGFTLDNVSRFAQAAADVLIEETKSRREPIRIAVGFDARVKANYFATQIVKVLAANGIHADLINQITPTPVLAEATRGNLPADKRYDYAFHVTASHNPIFQSLDIGNDRWLGIKILANGVPANDQLTSKIEARANDKSKNRLFRSMAYAKIPKSLTTKYINLLGASNERLRKSFDFDNLESKIQAYLSDHPDFGVLIDSMGGASIKAAKIFSELGVVRQHLNVTPIREGRHPIQVFDPQTNKPTIWSPEPRPLFHPELSTAIKPGQLGLVFDGDADRAAVIDLDGKTAITPNELGLIFAHYLYHSKGVRGAVVRTLPTTRSLDRFAKKNGLNLRETSVGSKHFEPHAVHNSSEEKLLVAVEESGHVFFQLNGEIFADSAIAEGLLVLEIIVSTGKSLTEYLEQIYAEQGKLVYRRSAIDREIANDAFKEALPAVKESRAKEFAEAISQKLGKPLKLSPAGKAEEGVTFNSKDTGVLVVFADDTWGMYRLSGTDGSVRLYGEENSEERLLAQESVLTQTLIEFTSRSELRRGVILEKPSAINAFSHHAFVFIQFPGVSDYGRALDITSLAAELTKHGVEIREGEGQIEVIHPVSHGTNGKPQIIKWNYPADVARQINQIFRLAEYSVKKEGKEVARGSAAIARSELRPDPRGLNQEFESLDPEKSLNLTPERLNSISRAQSAIRSELHQVPELRSELRRQIAGERVVKNEAAEGWVISRSAAFEEGLGLVYAEIAARSEIRVGIVTPTRSELRFVQKLNESLPAGHQILHGETPEKLGRILFQRGIKNNVFFTNSKYEADIARSELRQYFTSVVYLAPDVISNLKSRLGKALVKIQQFVDSYRLVLSRA